MREDEGTWLGHVLEHVAIELQNVAGEQVTFGKTRSAGRDGVYSVVYEYVQKDEGIEAGELAMRLLTLAAAGKELQTSGLVSEDWDWPTARDEFIRYRAAACPWPVDRFARACGRGTRHSVAAPEFPVADPIRLRQVPAAHPGHR